MSQPLLEHKSERNPFMRLLRTTSFRFTLATVAIFFTAVAVLGWFVYQATIGQALKQVEAEVAQETENLKKGYEFIRQAVLAENLRTIPADKQNDPTVMEQVNRFAEEAAYRSLRGSINRKIQQNSALRFQTDSSDWMYILVNSRTLRTENRYSLQEIPEEFLKDPSLKEFSYNLELRNPEQEDEVLEVQKRSAIGMLERVYNPRTQELEGVFFVAKDMTDLAELRASARSIIVRIAVATFLVGLIIGYLSSRAFLARIDSVNRTAMAIRSGDLSRRIPMNAGGDEFDMLAQNLNSMLDQIERLMFGMRQVSDNIAHDLRSPLTRIRNRIENALMDPNTDLRQTLEETSADADKLILTFNALLSITRIESGERLRNQSIFDMTEIVQEVVELYEPAAQEAGFELILNILSTPKVKGARELISQALVNLLDNAIKYGNAGQDENRRAKIEVKLAPRIGGGVLLSVMDNGPGVPVEARERIVSRFVRLESSRSTQGSGLGLSMVAAIVRAHGGQLSIGPGLPRDEKHIQLDDPSAYGLGVRIAFPAAEIEDSKAGIEAKRPQITDSVTKQG
ncbi:MAG: ATP-binding protein [bacterium]